MRKLCILILVIMLMLSGCFMAAVSENSTTVIEGNDNTYTVTTNTIYVLYRQTITYPDGTEYFTEYDTPPHLPDENFISNGTKSVNGEDAGSCTLEYDPKGNIIGENDGTNDIKYELIYDEKNQIIQKNTITNGMETSAEQYTYTDGKITETHISKNGAEVKRIMTEYDTNGNRSISTEYGPDGSVILTTHYEREESKEIARDYGPSNELLGYRISVYSYQNKLAKEECFSAEDELLKTSVWWYLGHSNSQLDVE